MEQTMGRALIVEDQSNWQLALKILLESEGIIVSVANGPEDAKRTLMKSEFDVIVLDIRLVDEDILNIDGLELLQYARENRPDIRVIVLTGYPENLKKKPDADALILKAPEGAAFDSLGFKKQVIRLIEEKRARL